MASSRTKYIGTAGTATLLLLIAWFAFSGHFNLEQEGDSVCAGTYEDPCEWRYNITLTTIPVYYIQNKDAVKFEFNPDVKDFYNCKKDGRYRFEVHKDRRVHPCGLGWREFDWKTPLTSRYKYINKFYKNKKQQFKIVVFKYNPEDVIKFGGVITKEEFDPYFLGASSKYNIVTSIGEMKSCKNVIEIIYSKCPKQVIRYYNYTHYSNITPPKSKQEIWYWNSTYDCNPKEVVVDIVCKTTGFKKAGVKVRECPKNYKCSIYDDMYCEQSCNMGDCNYNLSENKDWGWEYNCVPYVSLK